MIVVELSPSECASALADATRLELDAVKTGHRAAPVMAAAALNLT